MDDGCGCVEVWEHTNDHRDEPAEDESEVARDAGEVSPNDASEAAPDDTGEASPDDASEASPDDAGETSRDDTDDGDDE